MAGRQIALILGINVGRAKRVAMADLRAVFEGLGYRDVRTLLNSGNVVFTVPARERAEPAPRIEQAMAKECGVSARVTVLSAAELATAVAENPLLKIAHDPSRHLVTVLSDPADRARLLSLAEQDWSPEALALGRRVAYLWCPESILESPVAAAVNRALGDRTTARNWTTITKLNALAGDQE
jgi:uncharacterized protein (DUF1697 family)